MLRTVHTPAPYRNNLITPHLVDDSDSALLDFVKTRVNSFTKWDLLKFFHKNADRVDPVENVARYIGRKIEAVKLELEELVESGLLEKKLVEGNSVYSLTSDKFIRIWVDRFILACENRHFRVKAIEYMIRGMR